ncbi:type II toxin-antitoxin system MqsR family toxin [Pseudomonas sp. MYb118]|uniref:type II toxin-antitoxin system MqsR family toxin n=1 Tax=Pseudomonas sp. MYb118 TaxID=1848720 RepID=UPI0034CDA7B6
MEKNTPHYDLAVIKADVRRLGKYGFTGSALSSAFGLGFTLDQAQETVFGLQRCMLYKSMTSYDDHRVWQDVYHTQSRGLEIYIKVTYRSDGKPPVISFKEKNT